MENAKLELLAKGVAKIRQGESNTQRALRFLRNVPEEARDRPNIEPETYDSVSSGHCGDDDCETCV